MHDAVDMFTRAVRDLNVRKRIEPTVLDCQNSSVKWERGFDIVAFMMEVRCCAFVWSWVCLLVAARLRERDFIEHHGSHPF
jgi:hypothetical protein